MDFRDFSFLILIFLSLTLGVYNTSQVHVLSHDLAGLKEALYYQAKEGNRSDLPADIRPVARSIAIVAVSNDGEGVVGNLTVKVVPGNNNVLLSTNPFVDTDLQYSANKAVAVAKMKANYGYDKDFIYKVSAGDVILVGGESAGAAMTIATISALEGWQLKNDTVITGTINPDGTIGRIGGVIEKAQAAAEAGYTYFLVPEGQSKLTYYERQLVAEPYGFGLEILNTRYVPRTLDLKKAALEEWGLHVVEVSTIDEALPFFKVAEQ